VPDAGVRLIEAGVPQKKQQSLEVQSGGTQERQNTKTDSAREAIERRGGKKKEGRLPFKPNIFYIMEGGIGWVRLTPLYEWALTGKNLGKGR